MKRTLINTAAGALAAVLLGSAGLACAQPTPAQIQQQEFQRQQNEIGMYYQQQQNNRRRAQQQQPEYRDYPTPIQLDTTPRSLPRHRTDFENDCIDSVVASDIGLSRGQIRSLCSCSYEELAKQFPNSQTFLRALEDRRLGRMSSSEYRAFGRQLEQAVEVCARPYARR